MTVLLLLILQYESVARITVCHLGVTSQDMQLLTINLVKIFSSDN